MTKSAELGDWTGDGSVVPVAKYVDASRKLDLSGIDWARIGDVPLDEGVRDCLIYMADIEGYTIAYLRDLLNTAAIDDADIARFMSLWLYEEMFHQEALTRFLGAYGMTFASDRGAQLRRHTSRMSRLSMLGASALSYVTPSFLALYMTWGALNELTTLTAYNLLAERARQPILSELLRRIVRDERRHFSFYYQQARERLRAPAAQWITSTGLRRFWRPVGTGVKRPEEVYATIGYCYSGERGRDAAREIDARMAALPGLGWFHMCVDFLDEMDKKGAERWSIKSRRSPKQ